MKRYSSYKDSGVEWIGEIPSEWGVLSLKYISEVLPSNVDKHIYPDEIPVKLCNYTDVYYNDYITRDLELKDGSCNQNEYNKFQIKVDDVIITKDSESPDDIGVPTIVNDNLDGVVCGYHLTLLRPHSINGGFLFRFIQSNRTRRYFEVNSSGITRYSLGKSSIENLSVPLPPLSEQKQIVSYLDEQTSSIDTLIQSKQKKITLLKEKRTSLINQVVTKGLNPDVEMKDSGVEWIGEIPSGWIITKLSYLMETDGFRSGPFGSSLITRELKENGNIQVLSPEFIHKGYEPFPLFVPEEREIELSKYLVKEGDIVIPIVGSIGRGKIITNREPKGILNQRLCRITPNKNKVNLFYIHLLLTSTTLIKIQYNLEKRGSILDHITKEILFNLYFPLPPLSEQMEIVEYLDRETELIDKTVSIEERKIELLKEYKQSLISEVVTGKRKVISDE